MTGLCSMHLKIWQLSLPWVIDFSKDHLFLVHNFLTVQVNWTDSPTCTILQWEVVVWLQWIGANSWGSLAFREIFLVTISTSCNLACNMLEMTRGINSYPLSAFIIFMSHCFVCWYYFQLNICSSGFLGGLWQGGGEGGSSSQSLHSIFLLCRPCNCKIFKFESEKIFSQLKKMLLNRKSNRTLQFNRESANDNNDH